MKFPDKLRASLLTLLSKACKHTRLNLLSCMTDAQSYSDIVFNNYQAYSLTLGLNQTHEEVLNLNLDRVRVETTLLMSYANHVASYESSYLAWDNSIEEPVALSVKVYERFENYEENEKPDVSKREIGYNLVLMDKKNIIGCVNVILCVNQPLEEIAGRLYKRGEMLKDKSASFQIDVEQLEDNFEDSSYENDSDDDSSLQPSHDQAHYENYIAARYSLDFKINEDIVIHDTMKKSKSMQDFSLKKSPSRKASQPLKSPVRKLKSPKTSHIIDTPRKIKIYNEHTSSHHFLIQNLWNLEPTRYGNVGKALMNEAINSLIRASKHITILKETEARASEKISPPSIFRTIRSTFRREKRRVKKVEVKTDSTEWELKALTAPITLDSVYESMSFYAKLGFQLKTPHALLPIDPQFPNFLSDLEKIARNDNSMISGTSLHLLKYQRESENIHNEPGIVDRFRYGTPTDLDWWELDSWRDATDEQPGLVNIRLDYEEFVKRYPMTIDFLDVAPWMRRSSEILLLETKRFETHHMKRMGYHYSIPMILSTENSFFEK